MSISIEKARYIDVMKKYLYGGMSTIAFIAAFAHIWEVNRDAAYAVKKTWPAAFDEELQNRLLRKEITLEQFTNDWHALWRMTPQDVQLAEIVDGLYSACDSFDHP